MALNRPALPALAFALLLGGCPKAQVHTLPDGCYRTADGMPLFRIAGAMGSFAGSDPRQFRITPAADHIEVYPHFYLHDSGEGNWIAVATQPLRSGRFAVIWQGNVPAISVPLEASGEIRASPGKPC